MGLYADPRGQRVLRGGGCRALPWRRKAGIGEREIANKDRDQITHLGFDKNRSIEPDYKGT